LNYTSFIKKNCPLNGSHFFGLEKVFFGAKMVGVIFIQMDFAFKVSKNKLFWVLCKLEWPTVRGAHFDIEGT